MQWRDCCPLHVAVVAGNWAVSSGPRQAPQQQQQQQWKRFLNTAAEHKATAAAAAPLEAIESVVHGCSAAAHTDAARDRGRCTHKTQQQQQQQQQQPATAAAAAAAEGA